MTNRRDCLAWVLLAFALAGSLAGLVAVFMVPRRPGSGGLAESSSGDAVAELRRRLETLPIPAQSRRFFKDLARKAEKDMSLYIPLLRGLGVMYSRRTPALVVVGAHEGDAANDPLWKLVAEPLGPFEGWDKLFIEPVPHLFARLKANLKRANVGRVRLANVAISRAPQPGSTVKLFCWRDIDGKLAAIPGVPGQGDIPAPPWYSQTCSVDPQRFLHAYDMAGHGALLRPGAADGQPPPRAAGDVSHLPLDVFEVPSLSLSDVLRLNGIDARDVQYLQVDVEGHELQVLESMPWAAAAAPASAVAASDGRAEGSGGEGNGRGGAPSSPDSRRRLPFQPSVLVYEHVLLSAEQQAGAARLLRAGGYEDCSVQMQNIWCVR